MTDTGDLRFDSVSRLHNLLKTRDLCKSGKSQNTIFFKYWLEAYFSEVKIPYQLHSHNGQNLFTIDIVTARKQSKDGKLCRQRNLALRIHVANDNPESSF